MKKLLLCAALLASFYFLACEKHTPEANTDQALSEALKASSPTGSLP